MNRSSLAGFESLGDTVGYFDPDGFAPVGQASSLFMALQLMAPVTLSASGARPVTGSLAGDVQLSGQFYAATLPLQVPGRVVLSQPFQRGMQVVGGTTEVVAGGVAIPESGGLGTTVGIAAIGHGFDTIQAGIRGTPTYTAQGMMALGASPTFAYVTDAGLGVGLNFGAGMMRPLTGGGSVIHLTSAGDASAINLSGRLGGRYGLFGIQAGQVPNSQLARALLTGAGDRTASVAISGDAANVFRAPPMVGPISDLRAAFGVRSSPLGSVDLTTGRFIPGEVFNGGRFSTATTADYMRYLGHQSLVDYVPDAIFGAGRIGAGYGEGISSGSGVQVIGKKPQQ